MKKTILTAVVLTAFPLLATHAQNLNISCGDVTYSFSSEQTGVMPFSGGETLTVQDKTFTLADVTSIKVVNEAIADNLVDIKYDGTSAHVTVAGNIARYVDVSLDGANVSVTQSTDVGDATCGEITYRLSGTSACGGFSLTGSYKASIELTGVDLTSTIGAALDIQNGKRIAVRVAEGTINRLTDAPGGSQKGVIHCKGHLEFKQKGELYVTGNTSHAIYAKEYIEIKNAKITVTGAVKDGINCNQYFLMESGSLTISGTGDDGIQTSFKDDTDREAEDTGTITVRGGTINIAVTAAAAKAIKADGGYVQTGGEVVASTTGHGKWSAEDNKTKAATCISADGDLTIDGGSLNLTSTGGGGKGISCDGIVTINSGDITILTTGGLYAYVNGKEYTNYTGNSDRLASDAKSSPKGIKSDTEVIINGGNIDITTKGNNGEGIESKGTLTVNDGIIKVRAHDDAINSSSHMYINGGTTEVIATNNDGLDSNGNMYISGGTVMAFGASSPECGIDVNSEEGYKLYITGGYVLGVGGNNSTPSSTTSSQAYILPSVTVSKGTQLTVGNASETFVTFNIPQDYTGSTSGGGPGGWGGFGAPGGGGFNPGTMGGGVLISTPGLVSGTSYNIKSGTSTTTATARK